MHKVEAILANMEEEAVTQHQVHNDLLVACRTPALDGCIDDLCRSLCSSLHSFRVCVQSLLDQQNLCKMLETKIAGLELEIMESGTSDHSDPKQDLDSLRAINHEQEDLIKDLEQQLLENESRKHGTDLESTVDDRDAEIVRLNEKIVTLHKEATDKVNRANEMLKERDSEIQMLSQSNAGAKDGFGIDEELVKALMTQLNDTKARLSDLQVEFDEAKQSLDNQQAEFEQLLVTQAEEMTAEFEQSLQKQAKAMRAEQVQGHFSGSAEPDVHDQCSRLQQHIESQEKALMSERENSFAMEEKIRLQTEETQELINKLENEIDEKTKNCEGLKRLIRQHEDFISEQKKVLLAQASSASITVQNLQHMLEDSKHKLKDNAAQIVSRDNQINELQSRNAKNLRAAAIQKDREFAALRQEFNAQAERMKTEFAVEYETLKARFERLTKEGDQHMKAAWERQEEIKVLSNELHDCKHLLGVKDETIIKLSAELEQMQHNFAAANSKIDRMQNAILAQESVIEGDKNEANDLRVEIRRLEQLQADKVCEADLVAFEELAEVKSRLEVVQGEYEAMNEYVQSLPGHDVAGGLGQQVNIRVVKAQRATLTATGEEHQHLEASQVKLAQLEISLQKERERADASEHSLTQLKVDLIMNEKNTEESTQIARKEELVREMTELKTECRHAAEQVTLLQRQLELSRRALKEKDDYLKQRDEMLESQTKHDRDKLLEFQLEEARGQGDDLQRRFDLMFEQKMAVENSLKLADKEKREARHNLEAMNTQLSELRQELSDALKRVHEQEAVVEMLKKEKETLLGEVSGTSTSYKTMQRNLDAHKEQAAELMQRLERNQQQYELEQDQVAQELNASKNEVFRLQADATAAAKQISDAEAETRLLSAKVTKLETQLKQLQTLHDDLQEKTKTLDEEKEQAAKALKQSQKALQALQVDLERTQRGRAECEAEKQKMAATISEHVQMMKDMQSERDHLQADHHELSRNVADYKVETARVKKQLEDKEASITRLSDALESARKLKVDAEYDNKKSSSKVQALEKELSHLQAETHVLIRERDLPRNQTSTSSAGSSNDAETRRLKDHIEGFVDVSDEIRAELKKTQFDLRQAMNKIVQQDKEMQKKDKDTEMLNNSMQTIKSECQRQKFDVEQLTKIRKKLDADVLSLNETLQHTKDRLDEANGKTYSMQMRIEALENEKRIITEKHELLLSLSANSEESYANCQELTKIDALGAELLATIRDKQEFQLQWESERRDLQMKCDLLTEQAKETEGRHFDVVSNLQAELEKSMAQIGAENAKCSDDTREVKDKDTLCTTQKVYEQDNEISSLRDLLLESSEQLSQTVVQKETMEANLVNERLQTAALEKKVRTLEDSLEEMYKERAVAEERLVDTGSLQALLKESTEQLGRVTAHNESLEVQIAYLQQHLEQKNADLASCDRRLSSAEIEIQSLIEGKFELSKESAKMLEEIHIAKAENNNLIMRVYTLEAENEKLEAKATSFKSKLGKHLAHSPLATSALTPEQTLNTTQSDSDKDSVIQQLLDQGDEMKKELLQRKDLLEASIQQAENTMLDAERVVSEKDEEIEKLRGVVHRVQIELSMHKAEKEALSEDRQKLQRQLLALRGDNEKLQERVASDA